MSIPVRQIPLTEDHENRLIVWLNDRLEITRRQRVERGEDWIRWDRMYEGKPVAEAKNFPWPNASNLFVPVTGIVVDAVHANMMNRLFSHERLWDVKAVHPKEQLGVNQATAQPITWVDVAKSYENYLNHEASQAGSFDSYPILQTAIMQSVRRGTSVLYTPWNTTVRPDFNYDHDFGDWTREETVIHDGVSPVNLPLEDVEILPQYAEIDGPNASPLFGHRYWLRGGEIVERAKAGQYRKRALGHNMLERVLAAPGGTDEEVKDERLYSQGSGETYAELRNRDYQLRDLWLTYPWYEDGREVRLCVTYHYHSQTVMRVVPYYYKSIPYTHFRYIHRDGHFFGIGIPEILEHIQRGVNTNFNQAVDNVTIANVRCIKAKSSPRLVRSLKNLYPGKRIWMDNLDDIEAFQLGEMYPSIFQVGLLLRDFAERRSGVSDFNLGRDSEQLGRAAAATTTMALLQESGRRFDLYAADIRRAITAMGMHITELLHQFKPLDRIYATQGQDAELVEQAISMPSFANIHDHLRVTATSASGSANKEIMRQNALTAFSLMTQYLERTFQLATLMANPQAPEPLQKLAYDMSQVAERLMTRVLEGYDLPDIATMLPQLEGLINANDQFGLGGAAGGGNPGGDMGGPGGLPAGGQGGGAAPGDPLSRLAELTQGGGEG